MNELPEMSLMEHLHELRKFLVRVAIALVIAFPFGWYLLPYSVPLLTAPFVETFGAAQLVGSAPAEGFTLKLELAFFSTILIAFPYIAFEIWRFVAPALYPPERKLVVPFLLISTVLFLGGVVFCYHSVLPLALQFFKEQYDSLDLTPQIRFGEYSSMLLKLLLSFGICFELPVICALFTHAGMLSSKGLISAGRYAIVIIFIVAAVLTPPDVISQILLAVPLLLLYAVSIGVARLIERSKK